MFTGSRAAPAAGAAKPLVSWSFSRWMDYCKCPYAFKKKHIDKVKEPENEAMQRGSAVHTAAEHFIKGRARTLAPELKGFAEEFKGLKKMYKQAGSGLIVEDQWALDRQWQPSGWSDWNRTWLRVKLDCGMRSDDDGFLVFKPIDWKTGKMSDYKIEEYKLQLDLYATVSFKMLPDIEEVRPLLVFVDHNTVYPVEEEPIVFYKKDEKMLTNKWEGRVKKMFADKTYKPTPGKHCDWCMHSKSKGGDCKY